MNIVAATAAYEAWKGRQIRLRPPDLALKHARMREGPFPFLRSTFYRWLQRWQELAGEFQAAPRVLAVGDLHVENFGTWRDREGRLVWGINDFDEAAVLPYTADLARLAVSAMLALAQGSLDIRPAAACEEILAGYGHALACGGHPVVLAGRHPGLRTMATARLKEPEAFWDKLTALPPARGVAPAVRRALLARLPEQRPAPRWVRRVAGLGSLGHERVVALQEWQGGWIAREAKQLALSAAVWTGAVRSRKIAYEAIVAGAVRCPDPFMAPEKGWLYRRLAPDCSRIELALLPKARDERRLLRAMGFETGNVHLGSANGAAVRADLKRRPAGWLLRCAAIMQKAVEQDWREWKRG